jgi:hypothetical protein
MTCSAACRLRRRARLARGRHAADLVASRRSARERQRRSRQRRGTGPEPPGSALSEALDRAVSREMEALDSDGWLGRRRVELALRRVARRAGAASMSRAGLDRGSPVIPEA